MKRTQRHVPVMITHKKSAPQVYNLYRLQLINLDTIYKYLRHSKETG